MYRLTDNGRDTVLGLISSLCHGFDIEQAAVLNGLDSDAAKVMLMVLMADAGIIEIPDYELD